jgi:deoxycytidylate deaminase
MHFNVKELVALGERVSSKSTIRVKVAAILIDKRTGKVVATGYNRLGTKNRNGRHSTHAEVDALRKVYKPSRNLVMMLYRRNGGLITPCNGCKAWIKAYGIKRVFRITETLVH